MEKQELVILILILFLAVFFRFFKLSSLPPGLYPDEAINGNQALQQPGKIFYPENNGREGLFVNILALSLHLLSPSLFSLRLSSAIFGTATVFGVYLLGKEFFSKEAGLASAFLMAVSFWHVNFSRIVFRAILAPFFLVFSFYFLVRALKYKNKREMAAAGALYGLGFHTYIAYRISILILPFIFIPAWIKNKREGKKFLSLLLYFGLPLLLTGLPLAAYFILKPSTFISRAGGVSVLAQPSPLKALIESLVKHLGMFNVSGDFNWRHNLAGQPVLFWPTGILFLVGLFYSVYEVGKKVIRKKFLEVEGFGITLIWFGALLLPGVMTYEGIPHSLRVIGTMPAVYLLSGLGFTKLKTFIKEKTPFKRRTSFKNLIIFGTGLLLCSFLLASYSRYFSTWGRNKEVEDAFSQNYVEVGRLLGRLGPTKKYVVVNYGGVMVDGIPMPAQTPMFIERTKNKDPNTEYILPEEIESMEKEEASIIPLVYKEETMLDIIEKFPDFKIEREQNIIYIKLTP